jgi:hypothetical protein
MNEGWDSSTLYYAKSIGGIKSQIPKSTCSSLMDILKIQ